VATGGGGSSGAARVLWLVHVQRGCSAVGTSQVAGRGHVQREK
jgi:hypothetical protein